MARLAEAGLVLTTAVGNQKHFRANRAASIFSDLRAIVLKTVGLAEPIKTALASTPEQIELALIYGSSAKQSDHASSDVDLLIVSERLSLEQLYALLSAAEQLICRKISPTLLTPDEFRQRRHDNSPFLTNLLSGQHIVLVGDINGAGLSHVDQVCSTTFSRGTASIGGPSLTDPASRRSSKSAR